MLRRTLLRLDRFGDVYLGKNSLFKPKWVPRRLTMPVNTDKVGVDPNQPSSGLGHDQAAGDMQQFQEGGTAEEGGNALIYNVLGELSPSDLGLKLAVVPEERTVADCYGYCWSICEKEKFGEARSVDGFRNHLLPPKSKGAKKESASQKVHEEGNEEAEDKQQEALVEKNEETTIIKQESQDDKALLTPLQYDLWEMLNKIPLPSPVYGPLANKGKHFVESRILLDLCFAYPRLRSKHAHSVLHSTTGLLPCAVVANTIGMTGFCGVETDVSLWREMNYIFTQKSLLRKLIAQENGKAFTRGFPSDRLRDYQQKLKQLSNPKLLPGCIHDVQPRLLWLKNHVFAFIAFVEFTQGKTLAENLVRRLFLTRFNQNIFEKRNITLQDHVLEAEQQKKNMARHSTAGVLGGEVFKEPLIEEHEIPRYYKNDASFEKGYQYTVPEVLTYAVQPTNPVKEAQLILKYQQNDAFSSSSSSSEMFKKWKRIPNPHLLIDFDKELDTNEHMLTDGHRFGHRPGSTTTEANVNWNSPYYDGRKTTQVKMSITLPNEHNKGEEGAGDLQPQSSSSHTTDDDGRSGDSPRVGTKATHNTRRRRAEGGKEIVLGRGRGDTVEEAVQASSKHMIMNYYFKKTAK